MGDSLGHRKTFGVIIPSTNTSVQPEYDAMRPLGVTNHVSRLYLPDMAVTNDADFNHMMDAIRSSLMVAIDHVLTCRPDALIMGMSAETFWDGRDGSIEFEKRVRERSGGLDIAMGSEACQAALRCYGEIRRIAVITPYMPVADANVRRFFTECGFDVVALKGLRCPGPVEIAHVSEATLRDAMIEVNSSDVEAIVQVGTNLAMARLAGIAEFWLGKPVIAINTATYWHALRRNGIVDRIDGFGSLLLDH